MTLGEWIPEYLTAYKLHTIKDNSYYSLELVARHIPQELKDMELEDIRPMHLQRFFNDFAQTASKSYMDKMRVMVNALFETARDNDLCQKNPSARLKVPHIRERPREAFTLEEVRLIIDFAMRYPNQRTGVGILTLLLTGIRRGELLGIKPEDISGNVLTINRAVYLSGNRVCVEEGEAKTEASLRSVPLLPELAYRLGHLPHKGEFLFSTKNGTLLHPRNFSRDYDSFFRQLREEEPSVRHLSPPLLPSYLRHADKGIRCGFASGAGASWTYGHQDNRKIFPRQYDGYVGGCPEPQNLHYRRKFLSARLTLLVDVQGVTGSSPVPSTTKTPKAARLWEFFLCVLGRVSLIEL